MFDGRQLKIQDWLSVFLKIKSREDAAKVICLLAYILYFLASLTAFLMLLAALAMGVHISTVVWLIVWTALIITLHVFKSRMAAAFIVGLSIANLFSVFCDLVGHKWNVQEYALILGIYGGIVLIAIRALQAAFAFHKFSSSR